MLKRTLMEYGDNRFNKANQVVKALAMVKRSSDAGDSDFVYKALEKVAEYKYASEKLNKRSNVSKAASSIAKSATKAAPILKSLALKGAIGTAVGAGLVAGGIATAPYAIPKIKNMMQGEQDTPGMRLLKTLGVVGAVGGAGLAAKMGYDKLNETIAEDKEEFDSSLRNVYNLVKAEQRRQFNPYARFSSLDTGYYGLTNNNTEDFKSKLLKMYNQYNPTMWRGDY